MRIDTAHLNADDDSNSVSKDTVTNNIDDSERATQFWEKYSKVATISDNNFLEKNRSNVEGVMLFAGLFSAVSAAFLVAMESDLKPNPSDTTNALLMMLVHANNNSAFADISLPVYNGPSSAVVYSQALGYAALSTSLLAALGAVLGKQWLGDYSQLLRGPLRERCRRRQQKFDSLKAWRFAVVISALPALIQLALLLFSIALAITLWEVNRVLGAVIITATAIGMFLYLFMTLASLFFPLCPFQTPVSSSIHGVVGGVMKSVEEVAQYWAWHADKHNQLKRRPVISRGNILVAYIGGVLFYPLLAAVFAISLVLLAVLGPLVVLVAWVRGRRGVPFRARMYAYRSAFQYTTLKSIFHSSTCWVRDSACTAHNYIRRTYLKPKADSTSDPHAIAWILGTSTDPDNLMAAAEVVPDVKWPENLDILLPTDRHLYSFFTRSLPDKCDDRALQLGKAFIIMLCQESKDVSTHVWQQALRRVEEVSMKLHPDVDSDLLFILAVVKKLLRVYLKPGVLDDRVEFPASHKISQPLLSWFLKPMGDLLLLEHPCQSSFLPEAKYAFLELQCPEESELGRSKGLQYLRTFEIYINKIYFDYAMGAHVERMEDPIEQSPQEPSQTYADFPKRILKKLGQNYNKQGSQKSHKLLKANNILKRILEKLGQIDLSRLPKVHQHLIVPLTVLSRLASVSDMQQAFKDTGISLWIIKAFKETVGNADGSRESISLFTNYIMKLATIVDAFNSKGGAQVENLVTIGYARRQTPTPPVRMDSETLLSFLLNKDIPATSEQVVYALQIMLANVDELPKFASNPEFVNYILYATGLEQVYSVRDIGSKVLVAACKHLIFAHDAPSLSRLATQCDLVRFLRGGIHKEDPPTILGDLLRNNDENFNADLLKILASALGDPFNALLIKLRDEPNNIPEVDLRDLEIALVLSNMEGRKRLLYDHLDRCITLMPLQDDKYTMALPLAVIVCWLLRRDGLLVSTAHGEEVWKSFLRPNFEELLSPAWGNADLLEENPHMLRLLLDCSTRWLSTFAKSGTDSGAPSGSEPFMLTLRRLDGALDQLKSASQRLSSDIKRALLKLSKQIKQYLPEEE